MDVDTIIANLEARGLGWDVGNTGRLVEARIWKWPNVIGRHRTHKTEPIAEMLTKALAGVDLSLYPVLEQKEDATWTTP